MEIHESDIRTICTEWADNRGTSPEVTRLILGHASSLEEAESIWEDGDDAVERAVQALADTTGDEVCWGTTTFVPAIPAVAVEVDEPDDPEEIGGVCFAHYSVSLEVAGRRLELPACLTCGWLAPGADQDLDGSGLACWGDAQHGGWRSVAGDGVYPRRPVADTDGDPDDPIVVRDGVGGTAEIAPDTVAVWRDAVEAMHIAGEAEVGDPDSDYEALYARAAEIRDEIAEAINDALDDYDVPDVEEPASEEVWQDLPETDWPGIRLGDWQGAGLVLAWETPDGDEHRPHPDEDDVAEAVAALAGRARRSLLAEIERLEGRA
jgi:hypothetical protein